MKKKWWRPRWWRRLAEKKKQRKALRAHDGDLCWRCHHPMRFDGPPNCGKAATIEHVVPQAKGGTDDLGNLRLCHVGCNRHLADHEPEQKERMRINRPQDAARA